MRIPKIPMKIHKKKSSRRGTQVVPLLRRGPRSAAQGTSVPGATSWAHGRPWWEGAVETGKTQVTFGWEGKINPKDPESLYVFFMTDVELDGDELNGI